MNLDYFVGWLKTDFGWQRLRNTIPHFQNHRFYTHHWFSKNVTIFCSVTAFWKLNSFYCVAFTMQKNLPTIFLNLFFNNLLHFLFTPFMAVELPLVEPVDLKIYKKLFSTDLSTFPNFHCLINWSSDYIRLRTVKIWKRKMCKISMSKIVFYYLKRLQNACGRLISCDTACVEYPKP